MRNAVRRVYREAIPFLYGRTNYKLFLQRSFESLDKRIAATLCATNVLPAMIKPIPIRAPFGRSMLVVAPHQDDEIIGCGGAMLLQKAAEKHLAVVFTQDGGDEHVQDGRTREEQVSLREAEAIRVTDDLGIGRPRFLRKPRLQGAELTEAAMELREEILRANADVIFSPFILDHNLQHQLTNYALAEALAGIENGRKVMGYEVWGLSIPNVVLNIDSVQDRKRELLGHYRSQLSGKDYVHGITGLNMYHSLLFGADECRFAERFFEIPAEDFVRVMRKIRSAATTEGHERLGAF